MIPPFLVEIGKFVIKYGPEGYELVKGFVEGLKEGALDKDAIREKLKAFDVDGTQTEELLAILDSELVAAAWAKAAESLK